MPIRAVFFDIDGTLVDSNEQHVSAWALAFRNAGLPQEENAIRAQIGKGGDFLVPALLPDADRAVRDRIAVGHGEYFTEIYLDQIRPFPDAADLLRAIHDSGRRLALASSAKRDEIQHYIKLLGAEGLIDAAVGIDDVASSKPEPDIFLSALANIDLPAESVLAVGDTIYDVEAAERAGMFTIGLTSGPFDERTLKDAGAIAVYRDVADLLARLEQSAIIR